MFKINYVGLCSSMVPVLLVSSCPPHNHHLNVSVSVPTRVKEHMRHFIHGQQPWFLKFLCSCCCSCCFSCLFCDPFSSICCCYSLVLWFCCCCVLDLFVVVAVVFLFLFCGFVVVIVVVSVVVVVVLLLLLFCFVLLYS